MPAFAYQAIDAAGRRCRGREEAGSSALLMRALEARGLMVLDVDAAAAGADGARGFRFGQRQMVLEVTRTLAALLPAGMPLASALGASANLATGAVAEALATVRGRVEQGAHLAAALGEHPAVFSPLYVGLVRAGERSGDLAGAFARLAEQLDGEERLRSRLLSLSIYPLLLAIAGGLAVIVLLFFVLPRFVELLQGAGAALPQSTALLLGASAMLRRFWPAALALPVMAIVFATWCRTTEDGRRIGAALLLRLPLVRGLRRHALAARFARLLGVLLSGGAPLLSALDDALECLADPVARDDALRIRSRVREGVALHKAIAEGTLFPPFLSQLVAVGENSGRLHEFLLKAAEMFEARTERFTQRLVALAEPAMIIVFGAVVGFIALSLLQAIYGVNANSFR